MAKYESQYRSLLAQFGGQVNMYFNDSPAMYSAESQNFLMPKVETQPSTRLLFFMCCRTKAFFFMCIHMSQGVTSCSHSLTS